ncbi:MAG: DEAD/DEAH box helicase [Xanthobacteraceae bacterium]|nr:MAG: DEAD/DEAH box helicase [Xanthobacteraceae bacterium]
MTSFDDFGLAAPIARALAEENYHTPTPIQAQTLPLAIARRDVIGIAQTGTGKTAAFALPILHQLSQAPLPLTRKSCRVLVLSPTRELSSQIVDSFSAYGRHLSVSVTLAIGGVPIGRQIRALAGGIDILVATPGRLLDLVNSNALKLDRVEYLVLDEADRMLDMGFINDIRKIVAKLPAERQTLFFSATMPSAIAELARQMLRNPARVAVTPVASTAERIAQRILHIAPHDKPAKLAELIRSETIDRALVFTRTKHGADKVVRGLAKTGIAAEAIHGNKSQNHRERVLAAFREGDVRTLVATDIAARGIDVDGVSHVFNYDLPNVPESYVHRIGRTARAGAEGTAISFCTAEERPYLRDIEKLVRMTIPASGVAASPQPPHAEAQDDRPRGEARNGRPHGNRSNGGRSNGNRPHAGKPDGEKTRGGKPNGNGFHGTSSADKPAAPHGHAAKPASQHPRRPQPAQGNGQPENLAGLSFLQPRPARNASHPQPNHRPSRRQRPLPAQRPSR